MTQVFSKDEKLIPVTVVQIDPNVVTQVKTVETDGYNAIQLATVEKKEKNASKASIGHAKKANTTPKRFLKEIRNFEGTYNLGDTINADIFTVGEYVQANCDYPGRWQGEIERLEEFDSQVIFVGRVQSEDAKISCHVTSFIKMKNDKIVEMDQYRYDDGEAPVWRRELGIGKAIR